VVQLPIFTCIQYINYKIEAMHHKKNWVKASENNIEKNKKIEQHHNIIPDEQSIDSRQKLKKNPAIHNSPHNTSNTFFQLIAIHQFFSCFMLFYFMMRWLNFFSYGDTLSLSSSLCIYMDNGQLDYKLAFLSWLITFKNNYKFIWKKKMN
jgi:ATP-dependent Zn protease